MIQSVTFGGNLIRSEIKALLHSIKDCTICAEHLPSRPRPVLAAHQNSKILIIGQAPGRIVNRTGIPWDDQSGNNLRSWLGVTKAQFYNPEIFALIPMGFCYPGTGKSGDLPPRKECAPQWHEQLFGQMNDVQLTLLIGAYAQRYYLGNQAKSNLTQTVHSFNDYLPEFLPLPHPSPRNNIWQSKNPWFAKQILPELQSIVQTAL